MNRFHKTFALHTSHLGFIALLGALLLPSAPFDQSYHLSQLSSSVFPFAAPPPAPAPLFFTAPVPIALLPAPCLAAPASAKLSQKSFLLSSKGIDLYAPPPLPLPVPPFPSTKRLKPSAALLAPVCAPFATLAAAMRACAARSLSATCENGGSSASLVCDLSRRKRFLRPPSHPRLSVEYGHDLGGLQLMRMTCV